MKKSLRVCNKVVGANLNPESKIDLKKLKIEMKSMKKSSKSMTMSTKMVNFFCQSMLDFVIIK